MNMGSLERQLMDSFKDMDTKEKEKEQKDAAQMMTKEEADHAQKINKRWAVSLALNLRRKEKIYLKWQKLAAEKIDDSKDFDF